MKKSIGFVLITIILVSSIAFANMSNFTKEKTYANEFSDIQQTSWYYDSVKEVYELNIFNGISNTEFGPDGNITIAQAIRLASTIHNIYHQNGEIFKKNDGEQWYTPYVKYAINNQIISNEYLNYNDNSSRSELVKILSKALPDNEFNSISSINRIPDVAKSDTNGEEIYKFYNAGILSGSDKKGTFNPQSNIKRCEVAAIITRLVNPQKRLSFNIEYDPLEELDYVDEVLGINIKDYSYYFSGKGNKTITQTMWLHDDKPCTITYKFDNGADFKFEIVDNYGDIVTMLEETPENNESTSKLNVISNGEPLKVNVESTGNWEILITPIHGKTDLAINGKDKFVSGYFIPEVENYTLTYTNKGNSPFEFWISPNKESNPENTIFRSNPPGNCNEQETIKLAKGVPYYFDIRTGGEWTISLEPITATSVKNADEMENVSQEIAPLDVLSTIIKANINALTYYGKAKDENHYALQYETAQYKKRGAKEVQKYVNATIKYLDEGINACSNYSNTQTMKNVLIKWKNSLTGIKGIDKTLGDWGADYMATLNVITGFYDTMQTAIDCMDEISNIQNDWKTEYSKIYDNN